MRKIILLLLLFCVIPAQAGIEVRDFKTPQLEARYRDLTENLRCLVCQNENLAASDAQLAGQLRDQIYKMLNEGASNKKIVDYMVARYGDFVLYKPPLMPTTYLLWLGPFVFLVIGIILMPALLRRNRTQKPNINTDDYNKARELLADKETK